MVDVNQTLDPHTLDDLKILDQLNNEIKSIMVQLQNVALQKKQIQELMSAIKENKISQIADLMGGTLVVTFKDEEKNQKEKLKLVQERWVSFDNVEKTLLEQKKYRSDQLCSQLSKIHNTTKNYLVAYKADHLLTPPPPDSVTDAEAAKRTLEEFPSLKEEKK